MENELKQLQQLKKVSKNNLVTKEIKQTKQEYAKEYYQTNKQKIIDRGCQKVQCDLCLRIITRNSLSKHMSSSLCLRSIAKRVYIERKLNKIMEIINNCPPV